MEPRFNNIYGRDGLGNSEYGKQLYIFEENNYFIEIYETALNINGSVIKFSKINKLRSMSLQEVMLVGRSLRNKCATNVEAELTVLTEEWHTYKIPYFFLIPISDLLHRILGIEFENEA